MQNLISIPTERDLQREINIRKILGGKIDMSKKTELWKLVYVVLDGSELRHTTFEYKFWKMTFKNPILYCGTATKKSLQRNIYRLKFIKLFPDYKLWHTGGMGVDQAYDLQRHIIADLMPKHNKTVGSPGPASKWQVFPIGGDSYEIVDSLRIFAEKEQLKLSHLYYLWRRRKDGYPQDPRGLRVHRMS